MNPQISGLILIAIVAIIITITIVVSEHYFRKAEKQAGRPRNEADLNDVKLTQSFYLTRTKVMIIVTWKEAGKENYNFSNGSNQTVQIDVIEQQYSYLKLPDTIILEPGETKPFAMDPVPNKVHLASHFYNDIMDYDDATIERPLRLTFTDPVEPDSIPVWGE